MEQCRLITRPWAGAVGAMLASMMPRAVALLIAGVLTAGLAEGATGQLPDATQDFTGYSYESGGSGRMISPDGFFLLTSADNAVLGADGFGAYFNHPATSHGAEGLAQYMEIQANPAQGLGSFRLESMVVGDGFAGGSNHGDIRVLGYRDGVLVAETPVYQSPTAENNWPLDYSSFVGKQIDAIRIEFTVVDGTRRDDFNLASFDIADAEVPRTRPTVTTLSASGVGRTSATLGGEVTSEGDDPVTAAGVVWSASTGPTLADSAVAMGLGLGAFSSEVTGLPEDTQIYVRAYATSAAGTSYGSEISFSTLAPTPPGPVTLSAPIDDVVGAEVRPTLEWEAATGAASYELALSLNSDLSAPLLSLAGLSGSSHAVASDLSHGTEYFWRVRAVNDDGNGPWSATASFVVETVAPIVTTGAVSDVTSSGASVAGEVTADGGATVTARGVVFATSASPTLADASVVIGSGTGAFNSTLSGLDPATTYYVRAYATNVEGTSYGAETTFTTGAVAPTVTTGAVSDVTASGAGVAGEVTADGGAAVSERGVAYATTSNPTIADASVVSGSGTGAFSADLGGLDPATTYYVRAYATNAEGTSYGAETAFTTGAVPPTVTTGAVSGVTASGASVAGEVTADGGAAVSARGVAYAKAANPSLADASVAGGSGTGAFDAELTGLDAGTTYYVRAYATNAEGTTYGAETTFTTDAVVPTVTTGTVSAVTSADASVAGEVTADGGAAVSARGVVYGTTSNPTVADASVVSGSGTGAFSAGLTDLAPATTYYVRAYATNAEGTSYGSEVSFTTAGVLPTVVTGAVSGVTTDGGTVGAEVTDDGGLTITDRGVVYAIDPSPTLADAVLQSGTGAGSFAADLDGLEPGQTYYARAYATNALGTSYGDEVTIAVDRLAQTIDFGPLEGRVYGDASVALQATASSGLAVTLASSAEDVATVDGGSLVLTGAGQVVITATQAGDGTYLAAPVVQRTLMVERRPVTGTFTIQDPKAYDGETDADVLTRALAGVLPADVGEVTLSGGTATFADADLGSAKTVTLTGASLSGTRAAHYELVAVESTTGSIVTGAPYTVRLEGPDALVAGMPGTYTLTLVDAYGHPTTTDAPLTFSLASSLEGAGSFEPATLSVGAGGSSATFTYTSTQAADAAETLSLEPTGGPALAGGPLPTVQATVAAAEVDHFTVVVDEAVVSEGATVGSEVLVRVTARDAFGNLVPSYNGTAAVTSDTELSSGGGTTPAFVDGVLEAHAVVFGSAGATELTVAATVGGQSVTGTSPSFQTRFAEAQLSIDLVTDEERPALGSEITLQVVVTNEGWTVAGSVVVDDPLAGQDRLEALEVQVDQGSVDETSGAWTIDTLASGATATMTIRARVVQP